MSIHEPWFERFCLLLLRGQPTSVAIDHAVACGSSLQDAEAAAKIVLASPLFTVAHKLCVQVVCRDWMLSTICSLAARGADLGAIDYRDTIGRTEFMEEYYSRNRALFLSGAASGWPAVAKWSAGYLKKRCGAEIVEIMVGREAAAISDQSTSDALRRRVVFAEYIDAVYSAGWTNDIYMVARNRFFASEQTAKLLEDFNHLPFVNTRPHVNEVKLFFGPAGTVSPLHYDGRNNLLVQIVGTKEVRLYTPACSHLMAQRIPWYAGCDPMTSQDFCVSERQEAAGITVHLEPGDAVFIPVGWWHAVTAHTVSMSVSFYDFGIENRFQFPVRGSIAIPHALKISSERVS